MAGEQIKVRTKQTPWKETVLTGGQRELDQLTNLGLIYEGKAETDESAAKAVEAAQRAAAGNPDKAPG